MFSFHFIMEALRKKVQRENQLKKSEQQIVKQCSTICQTVVKQLSKSGVKSCQKVVIGKIMKSRVVKKWSKSGLKVV